MESLEELKNIIDSAPEGATGIDDYGDYIRYETGKKSVEYHCSIRGWWEVDWCDVWVMRPLSDIKLIIELMEIVEDAAALGFLTPSFDSGVSHKQLCKKYEDLI